MASFGAQLKQEREKQGLTLEQISLSTKIGTRMLRALEEEHFDQLPGGIFNKGFIRAYARCLHMDEEQAIAEYMAATGTSPLANNSEEQDQPPVLELPGEKDREASDLPWGIFAVVLLLAAVGFAAWGFYSRESQKSATDAASPAASASQRFYGGKYRNLRLRRNPVSLLILPQSRSKRRRPRRQASRHHPSR